MLVEVSSNATIEKERQSEEAQREEMRNGEQQHILALSGYIRECWDSARTFKDSYVTPQLESAQRQRKGEYDGEKLEQIKKIGGSTLYRRLTATKCIAAESWIRDILAPAQDTPWSLKPTVQPDLQPEETEDIAAKAVQVYNDRMAQGEELTPSDVHGIAAELRKQRMAEDMEQAKRAADCMTRLIKDQMQEGGFKDAFRSFVSDVITYSAGILKAPVMRRVKTLTWGKSVDADGNPKFLPTVGEEVRMFFERVSPYDFYPSPNSQSIQDGYVVERQRLTRKDIVELRGVPGYSSEAIDAVLKDYGQGGLHDWTTSDSTRATLEDRSQPGEYTEDPVIDALEFHGSVQGSMLQEWGLEVEDSYGEYEIWAILIGTHVIKAELNPDLMGRRPYYCTSYEKVPGAIWGMGVPEKMKDSQNGVNATIRALLNNVAVCSGPQVTVNTAALPAGQNIQKIHPMKIWQIRDVSGALQNSIKFDQPSCNSAELLNVYNLFRDEADEDTGIPRYIYGNQNIGGAGETARGLSMLMNAASKGIKQVISNIDSDVLSPLVKSLYNFNMVYSDDDSVKGDLNVVSGGALSIIAKEQVAAARNDFLMATSNPVDMEIIGQDGRAALLREMVKSLDMPPDAVVPSERQLQEMKQAVEAQQQAQMQAQQQAQMEAQMQGQPMPPEMAG